jgi:hypothetical protein
MITYTNRGVRIAEIFFDEPATAPRVDVVRYQQSPEERPGTAAEEFHTIELDLTVPADQVLAQMHSGMRQRVRRALKEPLTYEHSTDMAALERFLAFWEQFAAVKKLAPANRIRLTSLCRAGLLDLARVRDEFGDVLVWHVYMKTHGRARLIHSASLFRGLESTDRNRISLANVFLHWHDIVRLQADGIAIYDLGGWYAGQTDAALLNINKFKEGFGGRIVRTYNVDAGRTFKGVVAVYARQALMAWRARR